MLQLFANCKRSGYNSSLMFKRIRMEGDNEEEDIDLNEFESDNQYENPIDAYLDFAGGDNSIQHLNLNFPFTEFELPLSIPVSDPSQHGNQIIQRGEESPAQKRKGEKRLRRQSKSYVNLWEKNTTAAHNGNETNRSSISEPIMTNLNTQNTERSSSLNLKIEFSSEQNWPAAVATNQTSIMHHGSSGEISGRTGQTDTTHNTDVISSKNLSSRWTEAEEVILQGVVGDCHLISGTQASWTQIANCYNIAARKFCVKNSLPPGTKRTSCALKKHFRVMHNRVRSGELSKDYWYNVYHYKWMSDEFNKTQALIKFNELAEF